MVIFPSQLSSPSSSVAHFCAFRIVMAVLVSIFAGTVLLQAVPEAASVFGDHMVLQRDRAIPIWGTGKPGEAIKITFMGHEVSTTTDMQGKWTTQLPSVGAGGPYDLTIAGESAVTIHDILVGDVWLCSGQSNMALELTKSLDMPKVPDNCENPQIRLLQEFARCSATVQSKINAKWELCNNETASKFSAVAYFFGSELQKSKKVPIGLVEAAFGGTPIEAWMSEASYKATPIYPEVSERWKKILATYPEEKAKFDKLKEEYPQLVADAKAKGAPVPPEPRSPEGVSQHVPTYLYNAMIAPLVPMAIRGVIWYQGEQNYQQPDEYAIWLPALIRGWRDAWGQGNFPFLIVQLPNFMAIPANPTDYPWTRLREAQTKGLTEPETALVVTTDVGDATNIHPPNKKPVGERLALAAKAIAYGDKIVFSGPVYDSMSVKDGTISIKFKSIGGGLVAKGGGSVKGFAVAGLNQRFYWTDGKIDGETITLKSDKVNVPIAARYAWSDNPACNLYNAEGLPTVPFRTDDFETLPGWTTDNSSFVSRAKDKAGATSQAIKWTFTPLADAPWASLFLNISEQNWTEHSTLHFRFAGGNDTDKDKKIMFFFFNRGVRVDDQNRVGVATISINGGADFRDIDIPLGNFSRDRVNRLCFSLSAKDFSPSEHLFYIDNIKIDNESITAK